MLTRQWAASVMMDSVAPTAHKRNVPLDPTFLMEMEAPKDAIAPVVDFAATKRVFAVVSRDTTELDVSFRQFWKHRMDKRMHLLLVHTCGEKKRVWSFHVYSLEDVMTTCNSNKKLEYIQAIHFQSK